MNDFSWTAPDLSFIKSLLHQLDELDYQGCDISGINLFLYSQKYNTKVCVKDNCLFRKFNEKQYSYYGYPVFLKKNVTPSDLSNAINFIKSDNSNSKTDIFFATDKETALLNQLNDKSIEIEKIRDLADYLYLQKNLSELSGSKYQKKRNHINQFLKKHPDASFCLLSSSTLEDAIEVENKWLNQLKESGTPPSDDLLIEKKLIETALENFNELELCGGIVYCDNHPAAMCIASKINSTTTDIHFEKAINPFAKDGAYAYINQQFAKTIKTEYINREEDLGFENLRKAKESYFPDVLLEKSIIHIK